MSNRPQPLPLPKGWSDHVRSGVLHVISLAKYAVVYSRGWAADSSNVRVRLKVENDQLQQWVAVVLDHYSRHVMGLAVFRQQPNSIDVRAFLGRSIAQAGATPKYLICDKGAQFWCAGFKAWCQRRGIRPRYGAMGQHGSLALIERFILTLKTEGLRGLVVSLFPSAFRGNLLAFIRWYNSHRPHTALAGATPDEIYHAVPPANQQPRLEPRLRWPRSSSCAKHAPVRAEVALATLCFPNCQRTNAPHHAETVRSETSARRSQ